MAVTPSGILSLGPSLLRDLIAGTSAFQAWTGTEGAADAKLRIHPHAVHADGVERPLAVVQWVPGNWHAQRGGYAMGALHLYLESEVSESYQQGGDDELDYFSAALEHTNNAGAVIAEACAAAEAAGDLFLDPSRMFTLIAGPARADRHQLDGTDQIDYYQTVYQVNFGLKVS